MTLFQAIFVPLCLFAAIFVMSRIVRGKVPKRRAAGNVELDLLLGIRGEQGRTQRNSGNDSR